MGILNNLFNKILDAEIPFTSNIHIQSIEEKKQLLAQIEQGQLPETKTTVPLQNDEICHVDIDASRVEVKTVTKGYSGGSRGVSIRLMKGVSIRAGNYRGHAIKDQETILHPGKLVVTNKKVVFAAFNKGTSIPLKSITNVEIYSNGIGIQKGETNYIFDIKKESEIVGSIILAAIKKYQ